MSKFINLEIVDESKRTADIKYQIDVIKIAATFVNFFLNYIDLTKNKRKQSFFTVIFHPLMF